MAGVLVCGEVWLAMVCFVYGSFSAAWMVSDQNHFRRLGGAVVLFGIEMIKEVVMRFVLFFNEMHDFYIFQTWFV